MLYYANVFEVDKRYAITSVRNGLVWFLKLKSHCKWNEKNGVEKMRDIIVFYSTPTGYLFLLCCVCHKSMEKFFHKHNNLNANM